MMKKIIRIDYIVDPLFVIDTEKEKTVRLVNNLVGFSKKIGKNPENLTILLPDEIKHHELEGCGVVEYNKSILEYLNQQTYLISSFIKNCTNFYIGDTKKYSRFDPGFKMYEGNFNWFLQNKDLEIDARNLSLFGHGVYSDACVQNTLNEFVKEIYQRHGISVDYKIPKKTSISSE